ncbi:kinase-like protein [Hesseltinella vesiculosa]|uniref:Kinase-like protein n=1 Tax=Hesseltinella vesiculosa TaxID=101127 RepID=A0A1X2GCE0_9FUNG|nr:kinase-like protein [Hesseltinella vesiculosa]
MDLKSLRVLNVIVQSSSCVFSLVRYIPDLVEFDQLIKRHFKSKVPFPTLADDMVLTKRTQTKRKNSLRKLFRSLSQQQQRRQRSSRQRKTNAEKVELYLQQCLQDPVIAQSSILRDFFCIQRDEDQKLPIKVASPSTSQVSIVVMTASAIHPPPSTSSDTSLPTTTTNLEVTNAPSHSDAQPPSDLPLTPAQQSPPESPVSPGAANDPSDDGRPLSVKEDMVSLDSLLREAISPPLPPSPITTYQPAQEDNSLVHHPIIQTSAVFPLEHFDLLKVLGKGCMGKVLLVRSHESNGLFALKKIVKSLVIDQREITHTLTEREILETLAQTRHPNLARLHLAFQDTHQLYLVTDYYCGGDLATQMSTCMTFSKERTRFYAAEMIEGIGELHRLGILYRDLKPENILLTREGHVVLTDFGLSKWLKDTPFTETFCGTAEYLAPEVLTGEPYSFGIDHWSYGTILYEMLAGITPFWADNHMEMYRRVLEDPLEFPVPDENGMPEFDYDTADFLTVLLDRDPLTRLGARGVEDIKAHPYFEAIDWDDVYHQRLQPPYVPPLASEMDFANFDATFLEMSPTLTPVGSQIDLTQDMQDVFDGYSFLNEELTPLSHELSLSNPLDNRFHEADAMSDEQTPFVASVASDDAMSVVIDEDDEPIAFQPARKRGSISMLSDVDSLRLESPLLHGDDDRGLKRRNTQSTASHESVMSTPAPAPPAPLPSPAAPSVDTNTSSTSSYGMHCSSTLVPESVHTEATLTSVLKYPEDVKLPTDLDAPSPPAKVLPVQGFAANQTAPPKKSKFKVPRRLLSPFTKF